MDNLRSTNGVADKTIFAILSECGDISRFHSGQAFQDSIGLSIACVRHNSKLKKNLS